MRRAVCPDENPSLRLTTLGAFDLDRMRLVE